MTGSRLIAATLVLSLILGGSVHTRAWAQSPMSTDRTETLPAQAPAASRGIDRYDIGAAAMNVLWLPIKASVCGIAAGAGALVFLLSFGTARGWTESAFDEGCIQNWLLTGADIRPMPDIPVASVAHVENPAR